MDFTFKERLELNESFREFSRKHYPLLEENKETKRNIYRKFLTKEITFSHRIEVEPTPYHPIPFDELNQRFRKILFDMNKKYKDMVDAVEGFLSNNEESQTAVETDKVMVL